MRFLIIEGTVRNDRKSIHAARQLLDVLEKKGHEAEIFDMKEKEIPLLKTRRYTDPGEPPEDIEQFGQRVEEADGLVLVSPEYNHTFPGALKNLLDYLYPEYDDKPFSFVTVSGGGFGGVRVQKDLENLALTLGGHPGPSLPVSHVSDIFDPDGDLVDEDYQERFEDFADRIVEHVERFQ
ncbi:MAG: NAD(P)H-dependent oxidoreductase [Candidatus Nanohaloarchaeota archaeon QJJ-7]|nr:NAD(P)H-dependent oxidoreductase [Candidatus Nanohaloarchaeota archaeon QJJ-7]